MTKYTLEYKPNNYEKRDYIRRIMLIVSIAIDLVAIGLIVTAIFSPLYFIGVALLFLLSNALRYIFNIYPKKYDYYVDDIRINITEVTPLRSKCILDEKLSDIIDILPFDEKSYKKAENDVILHDNSCKNNIYMIIFNGKRVVIMLDEYMYTLIDSVRKEGIE